MSCADIFLAFIAILFPPIAVWIKSGLCSGDSFINILLCLLGYLPGLLHAWYIIARNPEQNYDYEPIPDGEAGPGGDRVTYYYISHQQGARSGGYGTQIPPSTAAHSVTPIPPKLNKGTKPSTQSPQQPQQGTSAGPSEGPQQGSGMAPPTYAEAVKGDNKLQSQD